MHEVNGFGQKKEYARACDNKIKGLVENNKNLGEISSKMALHG